MTARDHSSRIFALRRQLKDDPGVLGDALAAARAGLKACPADPWVQKAVGWTLYDALKRALDAGDANGTRALLVEFDAITFAERDDLLHPSVERLRARLDPALADLGRARTLADEGRLSEALRLYARMFSAARGGVPDELKRNYAWAIYKQVRALVTRDAPPVGQVAALLRRFVELDVSRRERVTLLTLRASCKVAGEHDAFYELAAEWWGADALADEDFVREQMPDGKYTPSLAETYALGLARHVEARDGDYDLDVLFALLDRVAARHPDDMYLPYAKGKLLTLYGRHEEARAVLIGVVRAKPRESWAWHHLASALRPIDPPAAEACLCKALSLGTPEDFVGEVRMQLAAALAARGEYAAARCQVERVAAHRTAQGWKPHALDRKLRGELWFDTTTAAPNDRSLLAEGSARADDLLVENLPQLSAVVLAHQPASERGPARVFVGVEVPGRRGLVSVPVRHPAFGLARSAPGTPVWVRLDGPPERPRILHARAREATPWDLLPEETGVVEHQNAEKGVAHVVLGPRRSVLLDHGTADGVAEWPVGAVVAVRVRDEAANSAPGRPRPPRAVSARQLDVPSPPDVVRAFEGVFDQPQPHFGFVDEVYVPHGLIEEHGLSDGDTVEGRAVCSGRGDGKWRAFELSVIQR